MQASILLIDPKYPHNVGNALRACAVLGANKLAWTGDRVPHPDEWTGSSRLPREERMKDYRDVRMVRVGDKYITMNAHRGIVPVCVEITENAESLVDFIHPPEALYVFGPEDDGVPRGIRTVCHRFVCIPGVQRTPLNLAAAVNIVLYDRIAKQLQVHGEIMDEPNPPAMIAVPGM